MAVDLGIVKKSGAWYTYEGEQLGQGRENAKSFLATNLEVMIEISEKVRQRVGLGDESEKGEKGSTDASDPSTNGVKVGGRQNDRPLGSDPSDDDPISLDD